MTRGAPKPEFVMGRLGTKPVQVDGSKRKLCAKCHKHRVWVTPAMLLYGMKVICPGCAPPSKKVRP